MPVLKELCMLEATLGTTTDVGATPSGRRQIADVTGGRVTGSRLSGCVLPSGGDWLLTGADGVGRLDVRATIQTDDGANIYAQYPGVLMLNEAVITALTQAGETQFGDTYFMTQPRFETGHPDYAWLNAIVAVGQGRILPSAVQYRIFEVCND